MGKIVYDKLFQLMKDKNVTTYDIKKYNIISESTLQSIRHNRGIGTEAIARLCEALDCQPGDIMEYVKDDH